MKARLALAAFLWASVAHAAPKPIEVYSIWYASDTTDQAEIETFHGCLMTTSTFGTWGGLWNVGPITLHPPIILATTAPSPLQVGTTLESEIDAAINANLVPAPTASNNTIYVLHGPASVTNNASDGTRLCYNNTSCGEHGPGLVKGKYYQAALVPIDCPLCGGTLKTATWIGMHEIAEAAADEGTASFEVGDQCEAQKNLTKLQCCGQSYTIQQLDTPQGPGACQTIDATGSMCVCGALHDACSTDGGACCSGMVCGSNVCCFDQGATCATTSDCCGGLSCTQGKCVAPVVPEAGAPDASNDASGDAEVDGPTDSGCSCRATRTRGDAWPIAIFGLLLLRRRRSHLRHT